MIQIKVEFKIKFYIGTVYHFHSSLLSSSESVPSKNSSKKHHKRIMSDPYYIQM